MNETLNINFEALYDMDPGEFIDAIAAYSDIFHVPTERILAEYTYWDKTTNNL